MREDCTYAMSSAIASHIGEPIIEKMGLDETVNLN